VTRILYFLSGQAICQWLRRRSLSWDLYTCISHWCHQEGHQAKIPPMFQVTSTLRGGHVRVLEWRAQDVKRYIVCATNHIPKHSVIQVTEFHMVRRCFGSHYDQACWETVLQLPADTHTQFSAECFTLPCTYNVMLSALHYQMYIFSNIYKQK